MKQIDEKNTKFFEVGINEFKLRTKSSSPGICVRLYNEIPLRNENNWKNLAYN